MTVDVLPQQIPDSPQQNAVALRDNLIDAIARAAADPNVDVAKMERLLEMKLRLVAIAAEASFNQAMQRLRPQLPRIAKNGAIVIPGKTTQRFMRYSDINDAVAPLLNREGFVLSFTSELIASPPLMKITAKFSHIDGHSDSGSVYLPLSDKTGSKNDVQGFGSVLTYGRRYALCQYLDIVAEDEDDDGMEGAGQPIGERKLGELIDMIADIKDKGQQFNDAGFLKLMNVKELSEITNAQFETAKSILRQKSKPKESKS